MRLNTRTTGGQRLRRHLRKAERQRRVLKREPYVEIGFFESAKYQRGVPVAAVAAWQEFGVDFPERAWVRIPSRPFFREAIRASKPAIPAHPLRPSAYQHPPKTESSRRNGQTGDPGNPSKTVHGLITPTPFGNERNGKPNPAMKMGSNPCLIRDCFGRRCIMKFGTRNGLIMHRIFSLTLDT